jgi:hypothetical protein
MLRENTFRVGGMVTIALGVALAYGLFSAGAGIEYAEAWLAAGLAVGFGAFFLYVAQDEARRRRAFIGVSEAEPVPASERRSP